MELKQTKSYETGPAFVKKIGTFGIVAFMILFIGYLVVTFFFGSHTPLDDYTPPQTNEYYAQHLEELEREIETNVTPLLDGIEECHVEGGKVVVTAQPESFAAVRTAILKVFGEDVVEVVV